MKKKIVKETFIIALLAMIIIFILGILFYDYIPQNKNIPIATEYVADAKVSDTLKEIKENQYEDVSVYDDNSNTVEKNSLLKSYSIGESELKTYATKKEYESGKTNPFADYEAPKQEETPGVATNTTTQQPAQNVSNTVSMQNSVQAANNSNSGTGTFFEKSGSK